MTPQLINSKMLNDIGSDNFTVTLANPLIASYVGLPDKGTELRSPGDPPYLNGNDLVLSIQPTGEAQVRPKGTAGAYERFKKQNGLLVANPTGLVTCAIPFVDLK